MVENPSASLELESGSQDEGVRGALNFDEDIGGGLLGPNLDGKAPYGNFFEDEDEDEEEEEDYHINYEGVQENQLE